MIEVLVAALIMLALLVGWFSGRFFLKRRQDSAQPKLSADYYKGINYLLNEKPDKALEVFLRLVEVDGETVETHVTLGKLFRRRGEIENAIRIHQNLIARPNISGADRSLALLELGKDYRSAGVLDRAEGLFKEVCEAGFHTTKAQQALRDIYVQEHEWDKAIHVAKALEKSTGKSQDELVAHYFCELACHDLKKGNGEQVKHYLQQAHKHDGYSLRANYMRADVEFEAKKYIEALGYYVRVVELDSRFASEALPKIQECLSHVESKRLRRHLEILFERLKKDGVYVQPLTRQIQETDGISEARLYLENIMDKQPGLAPLKDWLALHPVSVGSSSVEEQINKLDAMNHAYQCEQCGYNSRRIQWHCPSCANWGSIFPVYR